MIYNENVAMLYDVIFYLVTFYNKNSTYSSLEESSERGKTCKILEKVADSVKIPPQILSPLFICEDGSMSVMSLFFSQNVSYVNDTFSSFIEKLRKHSDILYQNAIERIFGGYEDFSGNKVVPTISPSGYIAAIDYIDGSLEFKLQVALLFGNFMYAMEILIETLSSVYTEIAKLYDEYSEILAKEYDSICTDESLDFLESKIKYDKSRTNSTIVSVTLLNRYLVYMDETDNMEFLMLGLNYKEFFSNSLYESDSGIANFIIACGSEIRMRMLQGLIEKKEMTLSEFAKYVGSQPTTVIRNLRILEDNGVLCVSRREAQQIFYKINIDLLKRVKNSFNRFVDDLIKQGGDKNENSK